MAGGCVPGRKQSNIMHPILIQIGKFTVRSYGVLLITGFLVGLWRGMRVCAHRMATEPEGSPRRITPDQLFDFSIIGLLLGIVGARILFVILNWAPSAEGGTGFASHPLDAIKIWEGGLSLHGGLLAGVLFMAWWTRRHKVSLLALADVCAPSWALGYVFGRIGCFLNGCCYGGTCDPRLPWAMKFHDEHYPWNPQALTPPATRRSSTPCSSISCSFAFWCSGRKGRGGTGSSSGATSPCTASTAILWTSSGSAALPPTSRRTCSFRWPSSRASAW